MWTAIKGFARDTFIYGLVGSLRSMVEFLLLPIYAVYLTPEEFGKLDLIWILIGIGTTLAVFELVNGAFRFYHDDESAAYRRRLLSTINSSQVFAGIAAAASLIIFSRGISGWLLRDAAQSHLIILGAICLLLNVAYTMPLNLLRLQNRPKAYAAVSLIQIILTATGVWYFVAILKAGVLGILLARMLASIPTLAISFIIQRSNFTLSFDRNLFKRMAWYSAPLLPVTAAITIINGIDRLFLMNNCSLGEIGLFSLASKITVLLMLLVMAFQLAWPQYAFSRMNQPGSRKHFARIFNLFCGIAILIAVALDFFSFELLQFTGATAFAEAKIFISPLSLALLFYGIFYIFTTGLNIMKKTSSLLMPVALGLAVNIALNLILAPKFGAMAIAWATAATYLIMALFTLILAQREFHIPFEWGRLGLMAFAGIAAVFGSNYLNENYVALSLPGKGLLFAGLSFSFILMGVNKYIFKNISSNGTIVLKHGREKTSDDREDVESEIRLHEIDKG